MAKVIRPRSGGKLALFEVIQAAQQGGQSANQQDPPLPEAQGAPAGPAALRHEPNNDPTGAGDHLQPAILQSHRPAPTGNTTGQPLPRAAGSPANSDFWSSMRNRLPSTAGPIRLGVDPASGRVGVSANPLGLGAIAAAMILMLLLSFGLGRVTGSPGAGKLAAAGPMPEVLDVPTVTTTPPGGTLANMRSETEVRPRNQPAVTPIRPEQLRDIRRTNGLNYVIVQSYLENEAERAEATRDILLQHGIPVTIERDVPGWPKRMCIVGTLGFERIRDNPEYENYVGRIRAVGDQYRGDRRIKAFDPGAVHWTQG